MIVPQENRWPYYRVALVVAAMLLLQSYIFSDFITDDALISLRYADRLLAGLGLTWTDGEYVEGYSNLLWVLVVSAAGALGFDLVVAARVIGIALMFVALFVTSGRSVITGILLASTGIIGAWAVGGLEQPLLAALLALAIDQALRLTRRDRYQTKGVVWCSFTLALLAITRSDGILFAAPVALTLAWSGTATWRRRLVEAVIVLALPLLFLGAQTAFRLWYYGEWVSNIALVKISPNATVMEYGIRYILRGYGVIFPLTALGLVSIVFLARSRSTRLPALLFSSMLGVWTAYLIFIGGDINPPSRHFVPIILILGMALREFVSCKETSAPSVWLRPLLPLLVLFHVSIQCLDTENRYAVGGYNLGVWRGRELGVSLKERFHHLPVKPLIAVDAAGAVPFWSGLPALDMLGLNDRYLAKNPPPNFGTGWIGHGLGNGDYVLRRNPDIIIFGHPYGTGAGFISGIELMANPEFHRRYEFRTVRIDRPSDRCLPFDAQLWVRKDSPVSATL